MNLSNNSFVNIQSIRHGENYQYPNNLLNSAFGELNLIKKTECLEIVLTILMTPVKEGSQTGVALDGSASMQSSFGRGWMYSESYDQSVMERLRSEGKVSEILQDGQTLLQPTPDGWQEIQEKGFVKQTNNELEPIARDISPYLAEKIDADGGTSSIYWACGPNGDQFEHIGDLSSAEAKVAVYNGPNSWGEHTHLLPAMRYFIERFSDAKWGFYVFVTDGRIDDLEAVKQYTADISKKIGRKEANPVNCILIGVGSQVDESQMAQLDDLPRELNLPVDIWDHKIAKEMRDLRDIFAEVVDENTMVAPNGRILDGNGNTAASFADGVPALLKFSLPLDSTSFTLEVGPNKIEQKLFL
jgi:hypothetical protein